MFTFRTSITFAVMAFIVTLTALLIAIQVRSMRLATEGAASAYMDATSAKVLGRLRSELATISSHALNSGLLTSVLHRTYNLDKSDGDIRDEQGRDYLFRLTKFALGEGYSGSILLLAAQDDVVQNVRRLQFTGLILAIIAGAPFIPVVWIFGSRMSYSINAITAQARKLQTLAEPDPVQVLSHIREIHELGSTVHLAQRAISSFARFVPKEIVRRVVDNSISTKLGGVKQEITLVLTDVQGFTTIAESADPDVLTQQTSRYFSALTEAFLAEGGTVDKFIGDAVMVFWNAPDPQPDHVARACRAALSAKAAGERRIRGRRPETVLHAVRDSCRRSRGLAIDQSDQGFGLEQVYSRERQTHRGLDLPLGVWRVRRADIQGLVIGRGEVHSRIM